MFKNVFAVGIITVVFFRYLVMRARWKAELMAQSEARVQARLRIRFAGQHDYGSVWRRRQSEIREGAREPREGLERLLDARRPAFAVKQCK